ncbi:MAG: ImmA/IrrE family metallo-endopeptidase [Polyangiaceae bacterium]|nr:ImmA/IrrE family metallo-endopeptidase [Polyangiaceae bacterium]
MTEGRFNPKMLTLARESRRMTQAALAGATGVSQGTISKLENGQGDLGPELAAAMARVLGYEPTIFFEAFEPLDLPVFFHRKRKSLTATDLKAIHSTVEIGRLQVRKLAQSVDLPEYRVPTADAERDRRHAADIARDIRAHWGIPKGPIENLTAILEAAGVVVLLADFGSQLIDGLSVYHLGSASPPVIFLNSRSPGERTRFTAAHELGHLVLHYHQPLPSDECEPDADAFAAEFLMPASEIRGFLGGLTIDALASLKQRWRVSMGALLMRASNLGRVTPYRAKQLWIEMSRLGYKRREPAEFPNEEPTLMKEIIEVHLKDLGYNESELAKVVHVSPQALGATLAGAKPRLRVVRS